MIRGIHGLLYTSDARPTREFIRGVSFKRDVADHGYGFVTYFAMPGGVEVQLYQPKYVKAMQSSRTPARRVAKRAKPARRAAKRAAPRRGAAKKRRSRR